MNKLIGIPVAIVFLFSISMNIFFVKNYDDQQLTEDVKNVEYIQTLEAELSTVKETLHAVSNNSNINLNTASLKDITSLEQSATDFLEHVYNITPDNYAYVKQNARTIMSKNLFETLYGSAGIDEKKIDYMTEVSDIEIYQHTKEKQVIVKYKLYTKQLSTDFETEENHIMLLYFKTKNDGLVVEAIEPISDMGAI